MRFISCALLAAAFACGAPPADEWDGAVARAVARNTAAEQPGKRLVVLGTVAGAEGTALPWAVRQSLTTGGVELGDTAAVRDSANVLLVFDRSLRDGADWLVYGWLLHGDASGPADTTVMEWRVRCVDDECDAISRVVPSRRG